MDLHVLAKDALNPIEKKLKGIYAASKERQEKEISTSNLVQMLIQEATDPVNLVCGRYTTCLRILFSFRQRCILDGPLGTNSYH